MNTLPKNSAHAGLLVNQALLKLVKQYGEASYGLLFDQFGDLELSPKYAHTRFSNKLGYLCQTDQLLRNGLGRKAVYTLGHLAFKPKRGTALASRHCERSAAIHDPIESEDSYLVSKALPNQYDVMRAPTWQASHAPVLRPGALDYQRYASHGDRC
ncbi:hypothetical protein [Rhodoferax sp.]|uniref:hypothetical protein n=1 Tax=Rhodoferax sp. TaxID=50421 RepID=UPI0025F8EA5B|nr:hypothetical protein [Rhodoferax sp.]MCM2340435.1 hypothetical protein [Rhodoferax sp.]